MVALLRRRLRGCSPHWSVFLNSWALMLMGAGTLSIVIYAVLSLLTPSGDPQSGKDSLEELLATSGWLGAFFAVSITIFLEDLFFRSWIRRSRVMVPLSVVSSLLFALIHATNYDSLSPVLYPIMLSPQFLGGLVLCFVRIELGFWSSFMLHMFYDLTVFATTALRLLEKAVGLNNNSLTILYVIVVFSLAFGILLGVFRKRGSEV